MNMDETKDETQTQQGTQSNSRPSARFTGSGGLNVSVWSNKNENGLTNYSVRLEKSYKGEDGQFHSTPYLRDNDLLRAQKLLEQADQWIEQEKGRVRGQASGQGR